MNIGSESYAVFYELSEGTFKQLSLWITLAAANALLRSGHYQQQTQVIILKRINSEVSLRE